MHILVVPKLHRFATRWLPSHLNRLCGVCKIADSLVVQAVGRAAANQFDTALHHRNPFRKQDPLCCVWRQDVRKTHTQVRAPKHLRYLLGAELLFAAVLPSDRTPPSCASQDPFAELETYNDNFVDRFFIGYFAKKMSQQLGGMAPCYRSFQLRPFAAQPGLLCTDQPATRR